jgi:hypothetical protein
MSGESIEFVMSGVSLVHLCLYLLMPMVPTLVQMQASQTVYYVSNGLEKVIVNHDQLNSSVEDGR